jgi:hypothetical protein
VKVKDKGGGQAIYLYCAHVVPQLIQKHSELGMASHTLSSGFQRHIPAASACCCYETNVHPKPRHGAFASLTGGYADMILWYFEQQWVFEGHCESSGSQQTKSGCHDSLRLISLKPGDNQHQAPSRAA